MRLVVVGGGGGGGAGGGAGRRAVTVAAERGHEVVAVARRSDGVPTGPGTTVALVDVRDTTSVRPLLPGADAVLWCVGVTSTSGGDVGRSALPGVLAALADAGVDRLVSASGAEGTVPGDRKGPGARAVCALTRRLAGDLVADESGEHEVLAASAAAWTEVRPPRLVDGPGRGGHRLEERAPGPTAAPVARDDVALALVEVAERGGWERRSPFLAAAAR